MQYAIAQGEFAPPNADLSFPRTIIDSLDIPIVKSKLNDASNLFLFSLIWNKANSNIPSDNTTNTSRRARSEIAREAAFIFLMQKKIENQTVVPLTPSDSIFYLNRVIDLLDSINTDIAVQSGWSFYYEWQFRAPELMQYLIAYDLLRGAGIPNNILTSAESKLKEFTGTLYIRITDLYPCPNIPLCYLDFFSYNPNNHGVMNSATLGLAGIVLGDLGDADSNYQPNNWINVGMWNLDHSLFQATGYVPRVSARDTMVGYAESPGYFAYGFKNAFPFIRAMWNFLPNGNYDYTSFLYTYPIQPWTTPEIITRNIAHPWYDSSYYNVYEWMNKIRMPDGRSPSIHDSGFNFGTSITALSGQSQFNIPNTNYPPTSIWQRSQYLSTNVAESNFEANLFQALPEAGSLVFRSDYDAPSGVYMHLIGKNGIALTGAKAHHQADATSFQLYFNGETMALDPGYPGAPNRLNAAQASDHNLILVNGKGPGLPYGESIATDNEVFIENYFDAPSLDYGELRGGWQGADVTRKTMFLHNKFFIITDFVSSTSVNDYQFQLHGHGLINASANSTEGAFIPDFPNNKITYSRNNTHLLGYLTARGNAATYSYASDSLSIGSNLYREHSKTLVNKNNVTDTEFLTILFPYKDSQVPNIQPITISDSDVTAAFIDDLNFKNFIFTQPHNTTTTIPLGSAPSNFQANGNTNLLSIDQTEAFQLAFMENGDSFFLNNTPLIIADKKLDIFYEKTGTDIFEGYVSDTAIIQFHSLFPLARLSGNIDSTFFNATTQTTTVFFSAATNFKFQENQNLSIDFYPDLDGDGFGDFTATPINVPLGTLPPLNHILNNGDCDDSNSNAFPGNIEICDLIDNNCNDETDEGFDFDNDNIVDCFDNCPTISNSNQNNLDNDNLGDACDCTPNLAFQEELVIHENPILSTTYISDSSIISMGNIPATNTIVFQATKSITLQPGFIAESGSDFTAKIQQCFSAPNEFNIPKENKPLLFPKKEITTASITIKIFPNPFQNTTTIFLQIEKAQEVDLAIYDTTGKLVSKILDKTFLETGEHQFIFNEKNNNGGLFYTILRTTDESIIQKMILIK